MEEELVNKLMETSKELKILACVSTDLSTIDKSKKLIIHQGLYDQYNSLDEDTLTDMFMSVFSKHAKVVGSEIWVDKNGAVRLSWGQ